MATYKIDPSHSEVHFKIKHLMIANVTGSFSSYDVTMQSSKEDFSDAVIHFEADVNSISTNAEQRDNHLKSEDFFDAGKFPKIFFNSSALIKTGEDEYKLEGNLTIRDHTKPVTLHVNYGGTVTDFYGQEKSGFEITGKINRKEFGLTWSGVTEAGGIVVSDEVKLIMNIQMTKQA